MRDKHCVPNWNIVNVAWNYYNRPYHVKWRDRCLSISGWHEHVCHATVTVLTVSIIKYLHVFHQFRLLKSNISHLKYDNNQASAISVFSHCLGYQMSLQTEFFCNVVRILFNLATAKVIQTILKMKIEVHNVFWKVVYDWILDITLYAQLKNVHPHHTFFGLSYKNY